MTQSSTNTIEDGTAANKQDHFENFYDADQNKVGVIMLFELADDGTTSWLKFQGRTANGNNVSFVKNQFLMSDGRTLTIPTKLRSRVEDWFEKLRDQTSLDVRPLDQRPAWVPETIWKQYTNLVRYDPEPLNPKYIFSHLLRDRNCESLWKTLERNQSRFRRRPYSYDPCVELMDELCSQLTRPTKHALTSTEERVRSGRRLQSIASELKYEFSRLRDETGRLPFEIQMTLRMAAVDLSDRIEEHVKENEKEMLLESEDYRYKRGSDEAVACINFLTGVGLEALARAGELWAQTKPEVYRPGDPSAKRLRFVRGLAAYFRQDYGTPFLEACATITRSLFGDEISAARVAQIVKQAVVQDVHSLTFRDMWPKRTIELF